MDGSIGAALTNAVNLSVRHTLAIAGRATGSTGGDESFGSLFDAQLQAHASAMGYELPGTDASAATPSAKEPETADEIWQRAKLIDSARNGQADAIMDSLAKASDERWERQHGRGGGGSSFADLFSI